MQQDRALSTAVPPVRAAALPAPATRRTIHVRHAFPAPPSRVFAAWLDPAIARRWLFATATRPIADVAIDARVGGAFRLADRGRDELDTLCWTGEYLRIDAPRRLAFTLIGPGLPHTRVAVRIDARGSGCELVLRHAPVPERHAQQVEERWIGCLFGLELLLSSGARRGPRRYDAGGRR